MKKKTNKKRVCDNLGETFYFVAIYNKVNLLCQFDLLLYHVLHRCVNLFLCQKLVLFTLLHNQSVAET